MTSADAAAIGGEAYRNCRSFLPMRINDAFLYGSYARGDFDENSDVDILLTADADAETLSAYRDQVAAVASDLSLRHDVTVSLTIKPLRQFRRFAAVLPFYRNVYREGIRVDG